MKKYKCLKTQEHSLGKFKLVPIRFEDRYKIMQWRNEQMYHLRQAEPLTKEKQDAYFENIISKLFEQEQPSQILFSFLENGECIGYGGLVHINWIDKNAEISFVMNSDKEESYFETYWELFLNLLKRPALKDLNLHKIYTYAFDLRPRLYTALNKAGFVQDARLMGHCKYNEEFKDVLINAFWNPGHSLEYRRIISDDVDVFYEWANDKEVRSNSLNSEPIKYEDHIKWFSSKLESTQTEIYIFNSEKMPVGQVRLDLEDGFWEIDYSVDKKYRGLGLGKSMISMITHSNPLKNFKALVKEENKASKKVFENLNFLKVKKGNLDGENILHEYKLTR
ncbi:GNAT family N-acetyltransferase [Psychroflexus aestuariivivens]|uniref:GNAT family N-acetyltransferase n=1 Tax=Psychroflexus aestuariivivens TaxID=1795040 RepID=UPI001300624C|nr:GNAT family N-acetyltransferase [Psychroflexus aestuariivivens]